LNAIDSAVGKAADDFTLNKSAAVGAAVASSVASSVASEIASSVASAVGGLDSAAMSSLASSVAKSMASSMASHVVTDASQVASALASNSAAVLNSDGTVNSSVAITDTVSKAQSAIADSTASVAPSASDDADSEATDDHDDETGTVAIAAVTPPSNPFDIYTSPNMFNSLVHTSSSDLVQNDNQNMQVILSDTRKYKTNINITAQLAPNFRSNTGELENAQLFMSKTALPTASDDALTQVASSGSTVLGSGLYMRNAIAIGADPVTIASGMMTKTTLTYNNVYLNIPQPTSGNKPIGTGDYKGTIVWTVNAVQGNTLGDTK
jgi:hypothetical protein